MSLFGKEPDPRDDYRALLPARDPNAPRVAPIPTPEGWWAMGLGLVALGGFFWSIWNDWPILAAPVLIAVPPLALIFAAWSPRRMTLATAETWDRRGPLGIGLYFGAFGLVIGALRTYPGLQFDSAVLWACGAAVAVGAVFAALCARLDKERMAEGLMLGASGLAGACWAGGLLLQVNGVVDTRLLAQTPAQVTDKYIHTRRRNQDSYELRLVSAAGGLGEYVTVDATLFARAHLGDTVCRVVRVGALGLRWRKTERCAP
jgi:hypothetical protein